MSRALGRRQFLAASALMLAGCMTDGPRVLRGPIGRLDAARFGATRRRVATRAGTVACVEHGSGPGALFLHGFPLNGFQWRGAVERLAPHRRCVVPDFLGMGHSRLAPGQDCAPEAQVAMLLDLLDVLSLPTVDVVASDSGGAVAQLLVAHHPERVRSLLLTNGDTEQECPPPAMRPVIELARQGRFVDEWLGRWHADRALARSAEGIGGMCYADAAHPTDEAIDAYFAPLLADQRGRDGAHAYAVALERNALAGISPLLRRCPVPVRIAWGSADTIFRADNADFLDRTFGRSLGVRRLADSKLFWPEERPDIVAEEALRLWTAFAPSGEGARR